MISQHNECITSIFSYLNTWWSISIRAILRHQGIDGSSLAKIDSNYESEFSNKKKIWILNSGNEKNDLNSKSRILDLKTRISKWLIMTKRISDSKKDCLIKITNHLWWMGFESQMRIPEYKVKTDSSMNLNPKNHERFESRFDLQLIQILPNPAQGICEVSPEDTL